MANNNADARAAAVAGTRGGPASSGGELRVMQDTVVVNALPQNDTITFGAVKLPKGAEISYAEIRHTGLGTGTTLKLDIGSLTDVIPAAGTNSANSMYIATGFVGQKLDAEAYPVATLGGANSAGSDNDIELVVYFTTF